MEIESNSRSAPRAAGNLQGASNRLRTIFSVILLAALITGLLGYKGFSGLSKLQQVRASGTLELRGDVLQTSPGSPGFSFLARSVKYLEVVWPALLFGVLIAAGVHTFVSPSWFIRGLGQGTTREQIAATVAGTPLMLCSCCAAPLFSAVYQRSGRLSPSLALLLASPGMNPASLALCFMLFPTRVAAGRVVMTLAAVSLASRLPGVLARGTSVSDYPPADAAVVEAKTVGLRELFAAYLRSCAHVAIRTLPLIALGIVVAMLIPSRLAAQTFASVGGGIAFIALVALFAVPVALPSFFEIPLAFSILAAGAPLGAAATVLFAGPIVNLPSLLVVGRHAGWKVSASLACSVWVIAFCGGLALH